MAAALTLGVFSLAMLVIVLRPRAEGLIAYCAALFLYPQDVTVAVGPADFGAGRLIVVPMLIVFVLKPGGLKGFKLNRVDICVALAWLAQCISLTHNESLNTILVRQGGALFDTVMPYLAVRLAIRKRADMVKTIKWLCLMAVPLAAAGVVHSVTWTNPYGFLRQYSAWAVTYSEDPTTYVRHGMYRASASFGNYIGFGMYFAALAPWAVSLLHERAFKRKWMVYGLWFCMMVGVASTLSSGPLFAVVMAGMMVFSFRLRRYWPGVTIAIILACVFLEFYSNRHFYEVPTRLAFSSSTANYRIGLYDEAFGGGMRGHWIFGYGYVGIGTDNNNPDFNWRHRDFTSMNLGIMIRFGLFGLLPFALIQIFYYRGLYVAARFAKTHRDRWFLWCFSAALVGWTLGTLTVGLVAQTRQFFYIQAGMAVMMPIVLKAHTRKLAAVAAWYQAHRQSALGQAVSENPVSRRRRFV